MGKPKNRTRRGFREEQRLYAGSERMQTAKLFQNGRSQAVRLPKEFRFEGKEVFVQRQGSSVLLTPKVQPREDQWKDFLAALDSLDPRFRFERDQPKEQQVRKSIEEWAAPPRRRPKKRK